MEEGEAQVMSTSTEHLTLLSPQEGLVFDEDTIKARQLVAGESPFFGPYNRNSTYASRTLIAIQDIERVFDRVIQGVRVEMEVFSVYREKYPKPEWREGEVLSVESNNPADMQLLVNMRNSLMGLIQAQVQADRIDYVIDSYQKLR